MDRIRLEGGRPLEGTIAIAGAKNTALKLMVASLLSDQQLVLSNQPDVVDVSVLAHLLAELGVRVEGNGDGCMALDASSLTSMKAPYDLVRKMRASILVFGPLLARCGHAEVSLPGGCAIGTRPVDLHIAGLEALGAAIELKEGYLVGEAPGGLEGAEFNFPQVSVGATEHVMMTATLARGTTLIGNAAMEPEIRDLADCLNAMGADIAGAGTSEIRINGVARLGGATHRMLPDRIEAGTYAMVAAATGGRLRLAGATEDHFGDVAAALRQAGVTIESRDGGIDIQRADGILRGVDVTTRPFPGFATDLQAQFMALMTTACGVSRIHESIFENRFMHVPELMRMGADIEVSGGTAIVRGVDRLKGAPVMATDLRASVCLILAGLVAEGETMVNRVYHLDRGYERLVEKLSGCGAVIERIPG